ncbi:hypothetical protein ACJX0J_034630, partial [Zea mays]
ALQEEAVDDGLQRSVVGSGERSGFAPDDPDLLRKRPVPDRLLVVSAGVAANLAFAFLVVYEQTLTVVPRRWLGHGCGGHGVRRASDEDVTWAWEVASRER